MQRLTPKNSQHIRKKSKSNRSISPIISHNIIKNKQNIPLLKNTSKQSQDNPTNKSIKICLQLASHHKKQSQDLKLKNQVLDYRLNEQLVSMQSLKKQLNQIHNQMQKVQKKHKKEVQQLKNQNQQLNKQIQQLKQENKKLNSQLQSTQSIITQGQNKSQPEIISLVVQKQSRRQKYNNHYQKINFVPSVVCLSCKQLQNQMEIQRENHCKQLLQFQDQIFLLQKRQQNIDQKQVQMKEQNQCISYLFNQLNKFEKNAENMLYTMETMENRIDQLTKNNMLLKKSTDRSFLNYSCSNSMI